MKTQMETIVNDDKVVSVCKRTITATIQKILIGEIIIIVIIIFLSRSI